jgi:subtilase family serine protease
VTDSPNVCFAGNLELRGRCVVLARGTLFPTRNGGIVTLRLLHRFFALVFLGLVIISVAPSPARAQSPMIATPPDNNVRVRIPNSTHPNAKPIYDAGPLDANVALNRMILVLVASPDQEHRARTLVDSQQTKDSPDYHRWVTPQEFGENFGPAQQDIQQVTAWLQQQGFTVAAVAQSGRWIEFSGSAAQVNSAFQTQMRYYLVNGQLHTANASDISIPAAFSPVVRGVVSLHDFYSQPTVRPSSAKATAKMVDGKPLILMDDGTHALGPVDIAAIYNLNPLFKGTPPSPKTTSLDGTGQTIAIVAEADINTVSTTGVDDVANFRSIFGLPVNPPNIIETGIAPGLHGASVESTLDVEWSGAVAPKATIDLVESNGTFTTDPVILSSLYIVDTNLAPIMNLSFHECESLLGAAENQFWAALWEQAAAQGISVFVASGDNGAADCESNALSNPSQLAVNGLSSTPFNTSVGGLQFDETINGALDATFWNPAGNALGYVPEMVWNDCVTTCGAAGGGGISTIYPVPSWQTLPILGLAGARYPARALPDVSLAASEAHDPYVFCYSGRPFEPDCQVTDGVPTFNSFAGGTSFASPEMAGIMALIDQATGERQGLANFQFYSLAAAESSSLPACNSSSQINPATPPASQCIFNDITTGNNGVPGSDSIQFNPPGDLVNQLGYNAVPGYDPASGLGFHQRRHTSKWMDCCGGEIQRLGHHAHRVIQRHGAALQYREHRARPAGFRQRFGGSAKLQQIADSRDERFTARAGRQSCNQRWDPNCANCWQRRHGDHRNGCRERSPRRHELQSFRILSR